MKHKLNLGLIGRDKKDKRDLRFCQVQAPIDESLLPTIVFNPVQIHAQWLGSCTGFSGATLASGLSFYENDQFNKFSGRWVYAWNKVYDGMPDIEGSYTRNTFKTLQKNGVPKDELCPIEFVEHSQFINIDKYLGAADKALENSILSYIRVNLAPGLKELKQAIASYKFAGLSMEWFQGSHNPTNYIIRPTGTNYGGHSICCCGYISGENDE